MTTTSALNDTNFLRPPPSQARNDELGQSDFLTLMITQFKNQDPFKPMENTELATQISQFATVSGIDDLNSSFRTLSSTLTSDQALQAARRAVAAIDQHTTQPVVRFEDGSSEAFDQVLLATHAPQALALLDRPDDDQARVLGRFRTSDNLAVLHSDPALMPRRRRVSARRDPMPQTSRIGTASSISSRRGWSVMSNTPPCSGWSRGPIVSRFWRIVALPMLHSNSIGKGEPVPGSKRPIRRAGSANGWRSPTTQRSQQDRPRV